MVQYDICCRFVWHHHLWCLYNCWPTHLCIIALGWDGFSWPSKMEMPRPSLGAPCVGVESTCEFFPSWWFLANIHWELTSICSTSQLISVFPHLVLNWTFKHSFLSEKHAGAIYGPLHHIASCTLLQIPHIPPAAADPLRQDVNQLLSSLLEGRPDETLRGDAWLQKARMRKEGSWGIWAELVGKKRWWFIGRSIEWVIRCYKL